MRDEAEGHNLLAASVYLFVLLLMPISAVCSQHQGPIRPESSASSTALAQFVNLIRGKAKTLEGSAGMRLGFRSFLSAHKLALESIDYSDYVVVRLLSGPPEDLAAFQNFAEDLQSPKQVLEDFVKSDLDGGRLTEKGRSDLSRFFTQGSEPQKEDKIVIVSPEYDVRETASAGDRAKFQLQYRHFYGKLSSALNFEPAADKASNGVPIKEGILSSFVLVRLFSPILHQTVSAEWRIDGPAPPICISLATAVRYVKEARERATDPTLKKNADQTLAKLMKLH